MKHFLAKFVLRPFLILLGVVALIYIVSFFLLLLPSRQKPFYKAMTANRRPAVFSHQGGEAIRPTNTAIAFHDTYAMGVDVLDSDVHMTKDGVLVLAHDETIDRTSNGHGAIRDMTYDQLKAFDFGYNFTTDNGVTYPYRGKGIGIMTLEELYAAYPKALFGLEIKQTTIEAADKLCAMTKKFSYEDKLIVSSFAQANMDQFRKDCPKVATSATDAEGKSFYIFHIIGLSGFYRAKFDSLQVPEYSGKIHVLTNWFVRDAHLKGYPVIPWTINEVAGMTHMSELGVEGINTNYPDRLLDLHLSNK